MGRWLQDLPDYQEKRRPVDREPCVRSVLRGTLPGMTETIRAPTNDCEFYGETPQAPGPPRSPVCMKCRALYVTRQLSPFRGRRSR